MVVYDIAVKLEQKTETTNRDTSARINFQRQDINSAYNRLAELEKKVAGMVPKEPAKKEEEKKEKKVEKVEKEPEEEPEEETDSEE